MSPAGLLRPLLCVVLVLLGPSGVGATPGGPLRGTLAGVVRDATGAPVAAVALELRAHGAGAPVRTTSDAAGRFVFEVPPGRYVIEARSAGFEPIRRDVVVFASGTASISDLVLEVAHVRVAVDVSAPALTRPLVVETDPRAPKQPVPAQDGADHLKTVPGFSVIRKGGTDGDPVFRGMAGSRLGVLLDGEIILGGCGNRMDPPTAYVFPAAYERVTIVKGPQTVSHGPGHSAGVVLFERTPPSFTRPGVSVYGASMVGSFGRNDLVGEVKGGTRLVNGMLSATRTAMGDYADGTGRVVHSTYRRWSTNGAFSWTPGASTMLEVSGALSDGRAAYADRMMDGVRFARENLGLRFRQQGLPRVAGSLEVQAYYNYVDHVMDNYSLRPFKASMTMTNPSVSNPDRRTTGGRASASLLLTTRTTALLGVDVQSNRHSVRSSMNQLADPFEAKARTADASFDNLGAYAEITQHLASSSRVVAGIRADRWSAEDRRRTIAVGMGSMASAMPNPTAGQTRTDALGSGFARYEREVGAATVYAGVGHARRAPDYWELFNKESADSLSAFATRPERTTQLDAGARFQRGGVTGSASLFASTIDDYILIESNHAKASIGMNGTVTKRNATISRNIDARSWGGEATLALAMTRRVKLDTSLAYVRGDNRTDDRPLAQQPPLEGRLGVQYSGARWSLGSLARLVAAQDRVAPNQGNIVGQDLGPAPAFAVFSVNGGWRLGGVALLSIGVDNLFDTSYAEFISRSGSSVVGFTTTTRVNEPGRTAWVKLDLRR